MILSKNGLQQVVTMIVFCKITNNGLKTMKFGIPRNQVDQQRRINVFKLIATSNKNEIKKHTPSWIFSLTISVEGNGKYYTVQTKLEEQSMRVAKTCAEVMWRLV